jgi:hypothetical protein
VELVDDFKFRQHVIIVFEELGMNLYKYLVSQQMKPEVVKTVAR